MRELRFKKLVQGYNTMNRGSLLLMPALAWTLQANTDVGLAGVTFPSAPGHWISVSQVSLLSFGVTQFTQL